MIWSGDILTVTVRVTVSRWNCDCFRCYYLALSYSTLKQWPEVVALCNRSGDYASQAQSAFNTSTPAEVGNWFQLHYAYWRNNTGLLKPVIVTGADL